MDDYVRNCINPNLELVKIETLICSMLSIFQPIVVISPLLL